MGPNSRRACCGFLFWSKVLLSTLLSLGGIGLLSLRVYTVRINALEALKNDVYASPDISKPIPTAGPGGVPISCAYSAATAPGTGVGGPLARLEPPNGDKLMGFSLDWSRDIPFNLSKRIGANPSV
ncbi:hypothetical protein BDK51DRAFT_51171, partial [Blyttiomyces helicus]